MVVDEGWFLPHPEVGAKPGREVVLDGDSRYVPAINRYPSAEGDKGFKPLADYVHSLGLKFGLHIVRGIPREAVAKNQPIAGSQFHAADVADTSDTCPWDHDNFGVRDNDSWIDELLGELGLADKSDANMRQLSGGMKRRVLVAQALVHRPPVIVLDEPTAGVDVELRQTLWQFVARLNKQGHTVLLTTHYLEEAEALADRIGVIDRGRLRLVEEKAALLARSGGRTLEQIYVELVGRREAIQP